MPKTKTTETKTAKASNPKAAKSTKKEAKAESCDSPSKTSTASLPSKLWNNLKYIKWVCSFYEKASVKIIDIIE